MMKTKMKYTLYLKITINCKDAKYTILNILDIQTELGQILKLAKYQIVKSFNIEPKLLTFQTYSYEITNLKFYSER